MEPITVSTLVLVSALAAAPKTATPRWRDIDRQETPIWVDLDKHLIVEGGATTLPKTITEARTHTSQTIFVLPKIVALEATAKVEVPIVDRKEKLYAELISYLPHQSNNDPTIVSTEEDIVTAIRIIRSLPSGIPLPTLMRNDDGEIGMYWDNGDNYVDINIEAGGRLSLFSRTRSTSVEQFFADIEIDQVNSEWATKNLQNLRRHGALA